MRVHSSGSGLSPKQKLACQSFIFIPQYGTGTGSLNVNVATSIVLNSFSLWHSKQQQLILGKDEHV
jgi:tRNA G18 (ribose-2'-O)-methylase SpoU